MRLKNDGDGGYNHNKKCEYNSEYDHDAVITLPMNYPNTGFTYFSPPLPPPLIRKDDGKSRGGGKVGRDIGIGVGVGLDPVAGVLVQSEYDPSCFINYNHNHGCIIIHC